MVASRYIMMATFNCDWEYNKRRYRCLMEAERQVAIKFPSLIKESAGWHRAKDNRYVRLLKYWR